MAPYLQDLFGYSFAGRVFELVFWAATAALGAALVVREQRSSRSVRENPVAWAVGVGLVSFGAVRLIAAIGGALYFGESGLRVPTYGVAMALGFAVPVALGVVDVRRHPGPLNGGDVVDLSFWLIVSGLAGAGALAWIVELPSRWSACFSPPAGVSASCAPLYRFWDAGLVFYGGIIGALIGGAVWCRVRRLSFLAVTDRVVPFMALGHAIGRLGCLASGCCYGAECAADFPFAVTYPEGSGPWAAHLRATGGSEAFLDLGHSLPVHAAQVYEAVGQLALFVGLLLIRARYRPRRGGLLAVWLVAYGLLRIAVELFRGDAIRGYIVRIATPRLNEALSLPNEHTLFISTSQMVALAMIALGLALALRPGRGEAEGQAIEPDTSA